MSNTDSFVLSAEELKYLIETVQRNDLRLTQLNEARRAVRHRLVAPASPAEHSDGSGSSSTKQI